MTRASISACPGCSLLALFTPLLFVVGCSTTAPAKQAAPVPPPPAQTADAMLEPKSAELAARPEYEKGRVIDETNMIFFSLGSSAISQGERTKLRDIAEQLKSDKTMAVRLIGYASDNGSSSFNLAVADSRVQSVSAALKKLGVKPQQIKKSVMGGEKTPNACRSAECHRKMRRVELIVSGTR